MSTNVASFLLMYNGQLSISDNFVPTYIGGRSRPLEVSSETTLNSLRSRVIQSLQIDTTIFNVNLICRIPVGQQFSVTNVDDEETCRIIMRHATSQFLVLYVDVEPIPSQAQFSQIDDIPGPSQIISTQIFANAEQQLNPQQHSQSNLDVQDDTIYDHGMSEAMYETMSSGSSEPQSDDFDEDSMDDDIAENNNRVDDIIHEYCCRTTTVDDNMTSNNEYMKLLQSTQEWDEEISFDVDDSSAITETDFQIPEDLIEGMCFSSKRHLQFVVQGWSVMHNVEYGVVASNKKKFTATCLNIDAESRSCKWRLHAGLSKRLGGVWKLSTLSKDHSCLNPILGTGHKQCTSKFISYFILPVIRKQIDLKPREIIGRMESKFNIRVSYMKAWDARRKALKAVFGSWEESYRSIYLFMDAINMAMPGSVYRVQATNSNRFQRLFWSFRPCIEGWTSCRPVLSLDGTFLLGKYRGTLLTAIGIDGNNGLFPLAFAVVESECNDSWSWFLRCLQELIPQTTLREDLCFISDRHAGIVRGCRELFPMAAHRACLRHLRENFKKAIRKMGISDVEFMCQKMYQAGNTHDMSVFNQQMSDIRTVKEEAYKWLVDHDIRRWTLTHDEGFRYGSMTTNAAECFNGVLKRARGLPIQALITSIYYNIIGIFLKRRSQIEIAEAEMNTIFCKVTAQNLINLEIAARHLPEPTRINQNEFQVFEMSGKSFRVDILNNGECRCQCGRPEIYHIPCEHVISCLSIVRRSHYDYVSPYFLLTNQKVSYTMDFHCIPDRSNWADYDLNQGFVPLTPPDYRRRSGRPRVRRYRNTMDESTNASRRTCSYCHIVGHNRTTCPRRTSNT